MQSININHSRILIYLSLLTLFFIFLELAIFISNSDFYLSDYRLVADHINIPLSVLPGLIYFLVVQLSLHIFYILFIWYLTVMSGRFFRLTSSQKEMAAMGVWLLGIITLLLLNHYLFPNSKFVSLTYLFAHFHLLKIMLFLGVLFFAGMITISLFETLQMFRRRTIFSVAIILISLLSLFHFKKENTRTFDKPNIIFISIDALRPDFLGYFGSNLKTAHLDQLLNHATVFSESLTPIARTFPSWVSIFTGLYPKVSGIRFDLANDFKMDYTHTLPAILRKQGYETIFATDEVRFSNISKEMGFDRLISPPTGFNDFLIGTFNDFPLSNLLVNTFVGSYLFPYNYANRADYVTYNPNTFIKILRTALWQPRDKPLFLAVHFCLAHSPYAWASQKNTTHYVKNYQKALLRVDQQVHDLLKILKTNHLSQHSIIVLLSDHGEAIELPGDRITEKELFVGKGKIPHFYPPSVKNEKVNQSAGHGTDVLGLTQYHNILAFRLSGFKSPEKQLLPGIVSLLDIRPTILDLLDMKKEYGNGKSLAALVLGKSASLFPPQDFFFESDFSPTAVRSVHPETRKLLFQGIDYYEIDPLTTRFTVKKQMAEWIISSKQYADLYDHWVLALYPTKRKDMIPILVDLETGQWTDDLTSDFAKQSPAEHMILALKGFYGDEILMIR